MFIFVKNWELNQIMNIKNTLFPLAAFVVSGCMQSGTKDNSRPNIVLILADDMGYSDAACYGGEVETSNLNRLAKNGLRYRQFYNNARSCSTRGSLMIGLYPHQADTGRMSAADMQRPACRGHLNNQCVTIAEVLGDAKFFGQKGESDSNLLGT